jgi:hypothetical protein
MTMTIRSCRGTKARRAASRVVLPEPFPPLIKNASFASIERVRSWAAPEVSEPEATQSWSEKVRCAGTRREMQVPGDAKQPSAACARLPSGSLASTKGTARAPHRQNRAIDILHF